MRPRRGLQAGGAVDREWVAGRQQLRPEGGDGDEDQPDDAEEEPGPPDEAHEGRSPLGPHDVGRRGCGDGRELDRGEVELALRRRRHVGDERQVDVAHWCTLTRCDDADLAEVHQ